MLHDLVIVGGGPAGMMAGLLFARAGVKTLVLEKHGDFLRDFRGDTVHPSTMQVFHELGLLDEFLQRPYDRVEQLGARIAGQFVRVADFRRLPVAAPFVALMPQWDFLDYVADVARRYPTFELRQSCAGERLVEEGGRVMGVRTSAGDEVRARLVIACDGRDSRYREGLPRRDIGAPMDVFWFRLPKRALPGNDTMGVFDAGRIFVLIDRGDYWQCAFVFPKGGAERVRGEGLEAFKARVRAVGPETTGVDEAIRGWDDMKLLTVTVDRLDRWWRPGLLVIGDAAHAMSPIGGVGVNLAVQDAVAAANLLASGLARGDDVDARLRDVQARRMRPVQLTQGVQKLIQDEVIAPLLTQGGKLERPPLPVRMLNAMPMLRGIPARLVGLGFRMEHVRSPDAHGASPVRTPQTR
jgi:2-polyprenyl-6-methoxyphenol hydroxylase-like FAD-dependent oxidoreductase